MSNSQCTRASADPINRWSTCCGTGALWSFSFFQRSSNVATSLRCFSTLAADQSRTTPAGRSMRGTSSPVYCPYRARHTQKSDASFSSESAGRCENPGAAKTTHKAINVRPCFNIFILMDVADDSALLDVLLQPQTEQRTYFFMRKSRIGDSSTLLSPALTEGSFIASVRASSSVAVSSTAMPNAPFGSSTGPMISTPPFANWAFQ